MRERGGGGESYHFTCRMKTIAFPLYFMNSCKRTFAQFSNDFIVLKGKITRWSISIADVDYNIRLLFLLTTLSNENSYQM